MTSAARSTRAGLVFLLLSISATVGEASSGNILPCRERLVPPLASLYHSSCRIVLPEITGVVEPFLPRHKRISQLVQLLFISAIDREILQFPWIVFRIQQPAGGQANLRLRACNRMRTWTNATPMSSLKACGLSKANVKFFLSLSPNEPRGFLDSAVSPSHLYAVRAA